MIDKLQLTYLKAFQCDFFLEFTFLKQKTKKNHEMLVFLKLLFYCGLIFCSQYG